MATMVSIPADRAQRAAPSRATFRAHPRRHVVVCHAHSHPKHSLFVFGELGPSTTVLWTMVKPPAPPPLGRVLMLTNPRRAGVHGPGCRQLFPEAGVDGGGHMPHRGEAGYPAGARLPSLCLRRQRLRAARVRLSHSLPGCVVTCLDYSNSTHSINND